MSFHITKFSNRSKYLEGAADLISDLTHDV